MSSRRASGTAFALNSSVTKNDSEYLRASTLFGETKTASADFCSVGLLVPSSRRTEQSQDQRARFPLGPSTRGPAPPPSTRRACAGTDQPASNFASFRQDVQEHTRSTRRTKKMRDWFPRGAARARAEFGLGEKTRRPAPDVLRQAQRFSRKHDARGLRPDAAEEPHADAPRGRQPARDSTVRPGRRRMVAAMFRNAPAPRKMLSECSGTRPLHDKQKTARSVPARAAASTATCRRGPVRPRTAARSRS